METPKKAQHLDRVNFVSELKNLKHYKFLAAEYDEDISNALNSIINEAYLLSNARVNLEKSELEKVTSICNSTIDEFNKLAIENKQLKAKLNSILELCKSI